MGRQSATEFWTHARVAKAVPRDFEYDRASGAFRPAKGRPGSGGGGTTTTTVTGASWITGGAVADTTGKVLFAIGASYYVCSANLVVDGVPGRSIVVTAAHCTYDETKNIAATNWVFIPNYDAAPAPISTSNDSYCASTKYGCWAASALVTPKAFADESGFTTTATLHDYAFAVLGTGGKTSPGQLVENAILPSAPQAISFSTVATNATAALFGYPAGQKYKGNDLIYCLGPVGGDARIGNQTYRVGCNMTGGSSGGPWFAPFTTGTGVGTQISVNSYGYSGESAMYGPKFNAETEAMFAVAKTTTSSVLYAP